MSKHLFALFATLFSFQILLAQDHGSIHLLCSPRPDSILLRWAPSDRPTWQLGNRYGYVVVRYTILRKGELLNVPHETILTPQPLKPRPIDEWEPHAEDKYVAIAAEGIFNHDSLSTGGNPFLVARRYQEEQNRFSFALFAADQSIMAASLSGLYWADKTARKDEKYLYRVYIPLPVAGDEIALIDTASAFTGISEYQPLPQPFELTAQWSDHKVELTWDILYLNHIYNSYIVEKSEDGRIFHRTSDNSVVQLSDPGITARHATKTDTLANNETKYFYRVRGISAFGELGPPSDPVSGHGQLLITHAPVVTNSEILNNQAIRLTWLYPEEMNSYISGFRVYRSPRPTGPKEKIHEGAPSERIFIDNAPELTNYYIISVFNSQQEALSPLVTYVELVDSIPPAPPTDLAGTIDSTGRVYLHWARNTEKDMDGYRIYKANRPEFEFILAHPSVIKDSTFIDSVNIKVLDSKAYYKLRAIDLRQNQSAFSDLLTLDKPDIIPPVSPVIRSLETLKGAIAITWINSSSLDVARHIIYRQSPGDTAYIQCADIEKTSGIYSTYTDTKVQGGKTYKYYIVAEDRSGLRSEPSKPLQRKAALSMEEVVQLRKEEYFDKVTLHWIINSDKEVIRILIYRSKGDAPLQLLNNTTDKTYTDNGLVSGIIYKYHIKAVYDDESTSTLSNEVVVKK